MKFLLLPILIILSINSIAQEKDSLLKRDINVIVEILEFIYEYDQTLREYTIYKTFDKSETNRIEGLTDSLSRIEKTARQFCSDTIKNFIWKTYINPMDSIHTKKLIEITTKYGFPSNERIKKYYTKKIPNPEFSALIIFIHSPKRFWKEIEVLMTREYDQGRINRCAYGYLKWHLNGRNDMRHFLENGYKLVEVENGKKVMKPINCD